MAADPIRGMVVLDADVDQIMVQVMAQADMQTTPHPELPRRITLQRGDTLNIYQDGVTVMIVTAAD